MYETGNPRPDIYIYLRSFLPALFFDTHRCRRELPGIKALKATTRGYYDFMALASMQFAAGECATAITRWSRYLELSICLGPRPFQSWMHKIDANVNYARMIIKARSNMLLGNVALRFYDLICGGLTQLENSLCCSMMGFNLAKQKSVTL